MDETLKNSVRLGNSLKIREIFYCTHMHFVVMTICGSFSCGFCLSIGNLFFMYKGFSTFHFGYPRKPFLEANFVFFYAFIPPAPLPRKHIGSFQRRDICWLFWAHYYLALLKSTLHVGTFWHDWFVLSLTFLLLLLTWKLQTCVSWVFGRSFNTLEHGSLRMVRVAFFFHFFPLDTK